MSSCREVRSRIFSGKQKRRRLHLRPRRDYRDWKLSGRSPVNRRNTPRDHNQPASSEQCQGPHSDVANNVQRYVLLNRMMNSIGRQRRYVKKSAWQGEYVHPIREEVREPVSRHRPGILLGSPSPCSPDFSPIRTSSWAATSSSKGRLHRNAHHMQHCQCSSRPV